MVSDSIKLRARELGFAACGICEARASDYERELRDWLAAGRHGEMAWLAERVDVRVDPGKLVEGAKSIIVVADLLPPPPTGDGWGGGGCAGDGSAGSARDDAVGSTPPQSPPEGWGSEPTGRIARYAHVPDYHRTIKKRLHRLADALLAEHPGHTFRSCVDTAPILEREHAQRAGIGWVGKHTLILNERLGSHLLLGEIVTTLAIEPDKPATDHCGTCTRCIDACPTDAIRPRSVDATKCISYLTIEHRSAIDPQKFEAMGRWVYGCDDCQDACPHVAKAESRPSPPSGRLRTGLDVGKVIGWTEDDRRAAFVGSAMKRAKLDMMRRNALIVAGNCLRQRDDPALRRRIEAAAGDSENSEMVRTTAAQVLAQLDPADE